MKCRIRWENKNFDDMGTSRFITCSSQSFVFIGHTDKYLRIWPVPMGAPLHGLNYGLYLLPLFWLEI